MLTKGIILNKVVGDNKYIIRIPILESAGDEQSRVASIMSIVPGVYSSYNEGDVVIVGFEDHSAYNPVIIGKLYLEDDIEARSFVHPDSLNVQRTAILPEDTKINGYAVGGLSKVIDYLNSRIDDLEKRIKQLETSS